jgi:hypothetical protein
MSPVLSATRIVSLRGSTSLSLSLSLLERIMAALRSDDASSPLSDVHSHTVEQTVEVLSAFEFR